MEFLMPKPRKPATLAIHGNEINKGKTESVSIPMSHTTTYVFPNSKEVEEFIIDGKREKYCYARYGNPAQTILQERFALIENSEDSLFFASGMAAITSAIMATVEAGDEVITIPALYGNTRNFLVDEIQKFGVSTKIVSREELYNLENIVSENTKLIYFESPTNPNLQLVDLKKVADQAKKLGIITMIDNTFATPINQKPIDFGIDIVVHSATKYIGGHSDILAGVVCGTKDYIKKVYDGSKLYGATIDPFNVFLLLRSLTTFELRVKKQNENAMIVAEAMQNHPKIKSVIYPGLLDHPEHEIAKKQMTGFGGMISIDIEGGKEAAFKFVDNLELVLNATSLGGTESLASIPIITSHPSLNDDELKKAGITKGMVRISIGLEAPEDVIEDFNQALNFV